MSAFIITRHDGPGGRLSFTEQEDIRQRLERRRENVRWGVSLLVVMGVSLGVFWAVIHMPRVEIPVDAPPPAAIAIDLAPLPAATPTPQTDAPPGPQQTQAQPVPEPEPLPELTAPLSPAPNPPVPLPEMEKPHPIKKKIKAPTVPQKLQPVKLPPALENTAPPSSAAPPSEAAAAPTSAASSSRASHEKVTWQGQVLAQLERFKRYPPEAQSRRQEGTPLLFFSMDRKGHVLSARIRKSSGYELLDQETLALVRRAEPLPPPPDSVPGEPLMLTVPVDFYVHE
ncbi:energy transducer TonB [Acetobacter sicerae]|uniref:Energy transducer TonB n=1 Tax=Acetobacter sicerae TaxID=85325 RepID=A0ABS8VTY8_9PROT|nr:energy transducer TonB [Acetobacter sicerae]MCE0743508.1 energy transducer TonB [Acetobacter sicerae]